MRAAQPRTPQGRHATGIDVVKHWLPLDDIGHVVAAVIASHWTRTLCGIATPNGEVTQIRPNRICRVCKARLLTARAK